MFNQQEAMKEIRQDAKQWGLTFKHKDLKINGKQAYQFVERRGSKVILDNQTLWLAYDNCQNGTLQKLTGNTPKYAEVATVEEYEICDERCWIVRINGVLQGSTYLDENELRETIGNKFAEKVVNNEAQDWIFRGYFNNG